MAKKRARIPELARWRYSFQIDVEETRRKALERGFSCRLLEGQPKNKKGKDGWGELYPLNQYEITGGELPSNAKIHIAPKATQIFFFGNEISKPSGVDIKEFERFLGSMEPLVDDLEKTERIMNDLAAFAPNEKHRFGLETRIWAKVPGMYRLTQGLKDVYQQILDDLMNKFWAEFEKACVEMSQGKAYFASRRLEALLKESTFFQQSLINLAREWKDPRAEQWEVDLNNALMSPFGLFGYNTGNKQKDKTASF
jgi:hypothetical protein